MNECHVLSLGAGVQSSTLALLAAEGLVTPMPEAAIFADTQAEPAKVYEWLDRLEPMLPFPVLRVTAGNLAERSVIVRTAKKTGRTYTKHNIPAFVSQDGRPAAPLMRQCTVDFKTVPIARRAKQLAGKKREVVQWLAISLDEVVRMKPSRIKRVTSRWPLIEMRWTREKCEMWLRARGLEVPRSACVFCPFHRDAEWQRLTPDEIATAADYERKMQAALAAARSWDSVPFLHRSLVPIDRVNFTNPNQRFVWGEECEGHCGV